MAFFGDCWKDRSVRSGQLGPHSRPDWITKPYFGPVSKFGTGLLTNQSGPVSLLIAEYVQACDLCVQIKASRSAPQGFLQPLPIPFRAWSDISIDYVTPLPKCRWNGHIYGHLLVVVGRLTKMRHLIPIVGLSAEELASVFVGRVYMLYGAPDNIVSDRGTQFVSQCPGVRLQPSSLFHPATNRQTERFNTMIEQYLCTFINFYQDDWVDWLPLAEFAANNMTSTTTRTSLFFTNYGFHPRLGIEPAQPCLLDLSGTRKLEFYK